MRFVSICIALSVGLITNSVYGMDMCRDAFGASGIAVGSSRRLAIRSVDPIRAEAEASLEAVNQFLAPSGLLTPKMLNLEIATTVGSRARFDFFQGVIRMQPDFAGLVPLDVHAPFIHEYGHAVFEYSALRDSAAYRKIITTMAEYQRRWKRFEPLLLAHNKAIEAKDFDAAMALRPGLIETKAAFESFQNANKRDLTLWAFGGVYQEAFADLLSVFFLKNSNALLKFDSDPLRGYADAVSPDHWMQQNYHYALGPFVRHVVQRTMVSGEVASPEALKIVHRLILQAMEKVQADAGFGIGEPRKLNKLDLLKREAYIQGYKVSDMNRDLIIGFDEALIGER